MVDLPRPDVKTVTTGVSDKPHVVDVTISREEGKERTYRGEGSTDSQAVTEVVKKILDDPHTAEYLPSKKK